MQDFFHDSPKPLIGDLVVPSPSSSSSSVRPQSTPAVSSTDPGSAEANCTPAVASSGPKARRAFKACAHCRSRKAKCDLGPDLNSPHEPPCTRCRREGVECTFLPSRRGGRIPFSGQKRKLENVTGSSDEPDASRGSQKPAISTITHPAPSPVRKPIQREGTADTDTGDDEGGGGLYLPTAMGHIGSLASVSANEHHDFTIVPSFPPNEIGRAALRFPPTIPIPPPISSADIFRRPRPHETVSDGSPESFSTHSEGSACLHQPSLRQKRRRNSGAVDPETLAAASLRNPVDALDLLVLAADGGGIPDEAPSREESPVLTELAGANRVFNGGGGGHETEKRSPHTHGKKEDAKKKEAPPPSLEDFPLVKKGVLSVKKLTELVDMYFSRMHFIFPLCPHSRIPRDQAQLAVFARDEPHLTTVFVVIASRHDRNPRVHAESWAYLQTLVSDIILGKAVSVGAVEALLLLSEYLPRQADLEPAQINAEENRMSWMLVGTAVRIGYMLRLDEKSLLPAKSLSESTDNSEAQQLLNRERVAWTYCYLFDRQISIRTGKAFWSRGPGLCFTGGSGGVYPTAAKNFPDLRFIPEIQDDFASLLQAYVELTQIMTSTNDILYPSRDRTLALVRLGEYYKYLDEFNRTLESFRVTWEGKRWATYPLTECVWIHFHYLRLYIYAFAFQAHVQRANWDAPPENSHQPAARTAFFPAGLVASPDAKFILEAIDAAADLLRLVTDRLHPGGALPFLPWRFFMMFSYAGVFLLKAVYVEAVAPLDRTVIIRLLKRLIFVLACASTDEQHPGVRYARLLNGLLRAFSQGHDSMSVTRAPTPARRNSIDGAPMADGTAAPRPDLDFGLPWGASPAAARSPTDGQHSASIFAPGFGTSIGTNGHDAYSSLEATPSGSGPPSMLPGAASSSIPFPMHPFAESQPFHQLANSLDANALDFDFGPFEDPVIPPAPVEAFNFLLVEDQALDFWGSFDVAQGDWNIGSGGGV